MSKLSRSLWTVAVVLFLGLASTVARADDNNHDNHDKRGPTILDTLINTDGAEAVVAAVLVVDDAGALPFSLANLLDDRDEEVVLLAPSNAAFEKLLGLEQGFLNGLEIEDIKAALPSLLPPGVGAPEVAAILLKHAALPSRATFFTASENALLRNEVIEMADGSMFPVGIGETGVQINYESTIIKADVIAKNGIIHYIGTVITDGLLNP